MFKQYRVSWIMALCALALMMLAGHIGPSEVVSVSAAMQIAEGENGLLYAGGQPPAGKTSHFSQDTLFQGLLLCVNEEHPLPEALPAQQSRDVRSLVGLYVPAALHVSLSEETIYALCDLASENPLVETWIMDGMRSPREQQALQQKAFQAYQAYMPVSEALARAQKDAPDSGHSEHQLATAFDVQLNGRHAWSAEDPMMRTRDGQWLMENAWRYGFIRRYPPEKSSITGVENEVMHWRYVGKCHAAIIEMTGLCLEEYLDLLHAQGTLCLKDREGRESWVLCRPCGADGADFEIPDGWSAAVSADNLGYAVCALTED